MGRILGIDYGSRRIGIALSDPLQILAQAFETIANDRHAVDRISEIVRSEGVEAVVVGMPYTLKGEKGGKAREVEGFIEDLEREVSIAVVRWDERFTSSLAQSTLLTMGTKRKERRENKGRVDAMAAAITLQGFLDSRKRSLSC